MAPNVQNASQDRKALTSNLEMQDKFGPMGDGCQQIKFSPTLPSLQHGRVGGETLPSKGEAGNS